MPVTRRTVAATLLLLTGSLLAACSSDNEATVNHPGGPANPMGDEARSHMEPTRAVLAGQRAETRERMDTTLLRPGAAERTDPGPQGNWFTDLFGWLF